MANLNSPRRLPPLNAIRAFEAAARHRSFTRAADELFVTQGAISHQVKILEEWFGFALFERHKREIHLTPKGEIYLPFIRSMLNELHAVTQSLMDKGSERLLCIATPESFAANWLISRLSKFSAAYPDIDVRLTTQNQIDDLGNIVGEEGPHWVDLRIRYGRGKWTGLHVSKLFDEDVFPVCHPELLSVNKLNNLEDIKHHTLIHDDMQMAWETWLRSTGASFMVENKGPRFSHSHMALLAAIEKQGLALGRSVLTADYIANGQLVRPFDIFVPAEHSYYLLCQERTMNSPKIKAFREWLIAESRTFASPPNGTTALIV